MCFLLLEEERSNVNVKFPTINFLFHNELVDVHTKFVQNKKVLLEDHTIAEYILGFVMKANVPWQLVDHV